MVSSSERPERISSIANSASWRERSDSDSTFLIRARIIRALAPLLALARARLFCGSRSGNLPARTRNKLALAIGADLAHLRRAFRAKSAFIRADHCLRIVHEDTAASFASGFH